MIELEGRTYDCPPGQSVLQTLEQQGVTVPSGCRSGVCQSCLMRCLEGTVPSKARAAKPTLAAQGYFLACQCYPEGDLKIARGSDAQLRFEAEITALETLNDSILGVHLQPSQALDYRAGQFIRLYRGEAESRCYSLASVPELDSELELHIRLIPGGRVSSWVHQELAVGQHIQIGEAGGECFYVPEPADDPLILLGTGSGLAPLYGIVRDALHRGHRGPVDLYHGSLTRPGLYREAALRALMEQYPQFSYHPCLDGESAGAGYRMGTVIESALADGLDLGSARLFLCGHPEMVKQARMAFFLEGLSLSKIYADPFLPS